jgi:Fe2+ or Zn2+ uptake regulation protein
LISIIATADRPLVNYEIRNEIQRIRPGTTAGTIDTVLTYLSNNGRLVRLPNPGSQQKYKYDVARSVGRAHLSTVTLVWEAVQSAKSTIDRKAVLETVRQVKAAASESAVDMALSRLAEAGVITRSKNLMTDTNANNQAKYVYKA